MLWIIHLLQSADTPTNRAVTRGSKGGTSPQVPHHYRARNHCGRLRMTTHGAEKFQQCHKYFLQYSTFASKRPQVRTWERQTCFLFRAPSNLVTPLLQTYYHSRAWEELWFFLKTRFVFLARRSHEHAKRLFDHNSPTARAIELFKPPKDAESLVVSIFLIWKVLDFNFCYGWRHNWERFGHFWPRSPGPGP